MLIQFKSKVNVLSSDGNVKGITMKQILGTTIALEFSSKTQNIHHIAISQVP